MQEVSMTVTARICAVQELDAEDRALLERAWRVRKSAQAPYSNYAVGAAVRIQSGRVYAGCNVERCTLTQTSHAEQTAVDAAVAGGGPVKITAVAIVAGPVSTDVDLSATPQAPLITKIGDAPAPCGHCLQIIWENCQGDPNVRLILRAANGQIIITTIGAALPMRFGPIDLGVRYST